MTNHQSVLHLLMTDINLNMVAKGEMSQAIEKSGPRKMTGYRLDSAITKTHGFEGISSYLLAVLLSSSGDRLLLWHTG